MTPTSTNEGGERACEEDVNVCILNVYSVRKVEFT